MGVVRGSEWQKRTREGAGEPGGARDRDRKQPQSPRIQSNQQRMRGGQWVGEAGNQGSAPTPKPTSHCTDDKTEATEAKISAQGHTASHRLLIPREVWRELRAWGVLPSPRPPGISPRTQKDAEHAGLGPGLTEQGPVPPHNGATGPTSLACLSCFWPDYSTHIEDGDADSQMHRALSVGKTRFRAVHHTQVIRRPVF